MSATQLASMQGRVSSTPTATSAATSSAGHANANNNTDNTSKSSGKGNNDPSKSGNSASKNADPSPTTTDPGSSGVVTQAVNGNNNGTVIPGTPSGSFALPPTGTTYSGNLNSLINEMIRNSYSGDSNRMYNTMNFCIIPVLLS
jgi:hypothetical protein